MDLKVDDFKITTQSDCRWLEKKIPGFRLLWWPDGTLCEPTTMVFGYRTETEHGSIKSMNKELYAVREFFVYLANRGVRWENADDLCLTGWKEHQLEAIDDISEEQVYRKIGWVFNFYQILPSAWPLDIKGDFRKVFVGKSDPRKGIFYPISTKTIVVEGENFTAWSGRKSFSGGAPDYTIPKPDELLLIYAALRLPNSEKGLPRDWDDESRIFVWERNFTIARSMVSGGLRAIEGHRATLASLTKMLRNEDIIPKELRDINCISEIADDQNARRKILDAINTFERQQRRQFMFYDIKGKYSKRRNAYFQISLVRDLLTYVWDIRPKFISIIRGRDASAKIPDRIFLSLSDRERIAGDEKYTLSAGAISDIMAAAFIQAGIEGSGHDLRKYYATEISVMILSHELEVFAFNLTSAVYETVLERVREALGHSKVVTSVKYYVKLAQMNYFHLSSKMKHGILNRIYLKLLDFQLDMSDRKVDLISRLISSIASLPDDSPMLLLIEGMSQDPRMRTHGPEPTPNRTPKLSIVTLPDD